VSRSLNKVMLIGNLGADPEIRSTSNGSRVANFSLATSRQWNSAAGEKQEKTEWHKCVVWSNKDGSGGLVDLLEKFVKKGDRLYVEGSIEYRSYEDKEKQTRYVTEVRVRELVMLGGRSEGGAGGPTGGEGGRRQAAPASAGAKREAKKPEGAAGAPGSFDDFPEALDEEDDDLPF
jgi:single-strand DNA-binding protein